MAIAKLTALEQGNGSNSNGGDVATAVNALIDFSELPQPSTTNDFMVVNHEEASGVAGDISTVADKVRQDRTLNAEAFNNIAGASLATNQVTLPAGTYRVVGRTGMTSTYTSADTGGSRIYFYNITDASDAVIGVPTAGLSDAGERSGVTLTMEGIFTIAPAKVFKLQSRRINSGGSTTIMYPANEAGVIEVYSTVTIQKL